ncbi:phage portal protein [Gordonibacter sp.]|uniref:phage portal protein n=1 Tax=Gordonibacter sp. TaxID=1968902 RepID=UPI002FC7BA20
MLTIEEIGRLMADDEASELKLAAHVGQRYYEGDHDILGYKLYYTDAHGALIEDKTRSNIKIPHPFFTELVDQCVQYMTSGDAPIVRSAKDDDQELQKALDGYFGDGFRAELAETLTDACAAGFGYMFARKGPGMRTMFEHAEWSGVIEVRAKETDANADHVIYWYVDRIDKGRKLVKRIQVWDEEETSYYVRVDNGQIALDESELDNPRPHTVYSRDGERYGAGLGFIPFFRLDANRKKFSHLKPVKRLIDDYDLMSCGLSNNIQDVSEAVWVVKGFQGSDIDELVNNVRTKKQVGVDADGDVDVRTIDIPYEARSIKLETDERNIYRFGMGLNSAQVGDGNITNVVIKSRYALLDLKCNKLEARLKALMRKLVQIALDEINGVGDKERGYTMSDVSIVFEREVMTNAADNAQIELADAQKRQTEVATLLNVATSYGDDAVQEQICAVLDLDPEKVRESVPEVQDGGLGAAVSALTGGE